MYLCMVFCVHFQAKSLFTYNKFCYSLHFGLKFRFWTFCVFSTHCETWIPLLYLIGLTSKQTVFFRRWYNSLPSVNARGLYSLLFILNSCSWEKRSKQFYRGTCVLTSLGNLMHRGAVLTRCQSDHFYQRDTCGQYSEIHQYLWSFS